MSSYRFRYWFSLFYGGHCCVSEFTTCAYWNSLNSMLCWSFTGSLYCNNQATSTSNFRVILFCLSSSKCQCVMYPVQVSTFSFQATISIQFSFTLSIPLIPKFKHCSI
ncbi:Hypothetical_protein [Hexamita inflata]|uniref:Hypothetical_protein n=1 Tax=Hexamita inflata TaxID=28002 RepID=A0AA86QS95_9EUKA|nr:Hypothetical protein HINF_LOCUS45954 [Hexamita inflata]